MSTKMALVGTGDWGSNWLRLLARLGEVDLAWVCDRDAARLDRAAKLAPRARATVDLADVLADGSVKAAVIASSAPTHAELALAALEAGKDVLVEKPMTLSLADAQRLEQAAARGGRILMAGHLLLYHPAVEKLRALVETGELGEVYYLYAQRMNLGKARRDENALWSFAPHDIAVALHLLGEVPVDVAARGSCYLQPGVEDVVFLSLRFPGGRMAHVHVSWLDPHKVRKVTLVGSKKMVVFDDMEPAEKVRIHDKSISPAGHVPFDQALAVRSGDIVIPRIPGGEPLERECRHFLECVEKRTTPRSDGAHGALSVRILEAAEASLKQNGTPVAL
ncbi:MAG TPA: Gfo/Idh/MocA family oxidoreductase [Candidatus Saccharimonadales bacterium]|nr:Gfo/Idh/MocA family oxidoreductase [Candidatus Saccharimonadales bacterium]